MIRRPAAQRGTPAPPVVRVPLHTRNGCDAAPWTQGPAPVEADVRWRPVAVSWNAYVACPEKSPSACGDM